MANLSRTKVATEFGERVVTSKTTYAGESRPDILISRRQEAQLFRTLRYYNWSKSIGAQTQTLNRLSNLTYGALQSLNTFSAYMSTDNFVMSVASRYAWVAGGRILGRAQQRLTPSGGGLFGRYLRVKGGQMSRRILSGVMDYFVSTEFKINNVKKVQKDVKRELLAADGIGMKWQNLTHVKALKNAPNFRTGGFGGISTTQYDSMLGNTSGTKQGSIERNSSITRRLSAAGYTTSEITMLQRFAEGQVETADEASKFLNAFGSNLTDALNVMGIGGGDGINTVIDYGSKHIPSVAKDLDRFAEDLGFNMVGNNDFTFADLGSLNSRLNEQTENRKNSANRQSRNERRKLDKLRREDPVKYIDEMNKRDRLEEKRRKRDRDANSSDAAKGVDPRSRKRHGLMVDLSDDGTKAVLKPRDGSFANLAEYLDYVDKEVVEGDFERHRRIKQVVGTSFQQQFEEDNFIPSQALIRKDIRQLTQNDLQGLNKVSDSYGFLTFGVRFGENLPYHAQQIEYGGPALDSKGELRRRTDRFVYPSTLFMTRSAEEAAQQLGIGGDIQYGSKKMDIRGLAKKNADKWTEKAKDKNRKASSGFRLLQDRQVREQMKGQAMRAGEIKYNNRTGKWESPKPRKIEDAGVNEAFRKNQYSMLQGQLKSFSYLDEAGSLQRVDFDKGTYPSRFESGIEQIQARLLGIADNVNISQNQALNGRENLILSINKIGHSRGAGILISDELAIAMGMKPRNAFGNRRFLDSAQMRNQLFMGGIFNSDDLAGAVLSKAQEIYGAAFYEDLADLTKKLDKKRNALRTTAVRKAGEAGLKRGSAEYENFVNSETNKGMGELEAEYQREHDLLMKKYYNPSASDLEEMLASQGTTMAEVENQVRNRIQDVINSSGRRNLSQRQMRRAVWKMEELQRIEREVHLHRGDYQFSDAIDDKRVAGPMKPNRKFDAAVRKSQQVRDELVETLQELRNNGITNFDDLFKEAGMYRRFNSATIMGIADEVGIEFDTNVINNFEAINNPLDKRFLDRDTGTREVPVYVNKKKLGKKGQEFWERERIGTNRVSIDEYNRLQDYIRAGRRQAGPGIMEADGIGGNVSKSKGNYFGDPTYETFIKKGIEPRVAKVLDVSKLPSYMRFNWESNETKSTVNAYKVVRQRLTTGKTASGQSLQDFSAGKKDQYGNSTRDSDPEFKRALTRIVESVGKGGAYANVVHYLLAAETDLVTSGYLASTLDPSNSLNNKNVGITAAKSGKNKNLVLGNVRLDKSKINYYRQRLQSAGARNNILNTILRDL